MRQNHTPMIKVAIVIKIQQIKLDIQLTQTDASSAAFVSVSFGARAQLISLKCRTYYPPSQIW